MYQSDKESHSLLILSSAASKYLLEKEKVKWRASHLGRLWPLTSSEHRQWQRPPSQA